MKKFIAFAFIVFGIVYVFRNYKCEVTKNTDSYIYDLPYKEGIYHKIVQGYGGLFSHYNVAALDFEMPNGTPVYAAREGVVYEYKDDSNEGGPFYKYKKKANYIIIKHNDGSFGCYWHLKQFGVLIKSGKIKRGDVIGYSGNTGFVLRPHLHFSVKSKFKTSMGNIYLEYGNVYSKPN